MTDTAQTSQPDLFSTSPETVRPQWPASRPRPSTDATFALSHVRRLAELIDSLPLDQAVELLNEARAVLHSVSPFRSEPVDCVAWVPAQTVYANDYNPNTVAPPEMELLAHSILTDGYTQPIVTLPTDKGREVVDGFHRNRVGKENGDVRARVQGYLPVVAIKASQANLNDRIAATIRHNRARGKHRVEAMSDIVVELKRRNWSDERICRELGMDPDEVLRLCQVTGLAELFSDQEFSLSWDVEGEVTESDFEELTDDSAPTGPAFRKVNTGGENRIFHTYDKWECHKAGFYASSVPGLTKAECEEAYRSFLASPDRFERGLQRVLAEWPNSCEHYLSNESMNRIAWLGQAAMCIETGIPSAFRGGFFLLSADEQQQANELALLFLNEWLTGHDRDPVGMDKALSSNQSDLY